MNIIQQEFAFLPKIDHKYLVLNQSGIDEKLTQAKLNKEYCLKIAKELEEMDEEFFKSHYRKTNFKVKQFRFRSIITIFGEIRFRRRQYISKYTNQKNYYYVDDKIKLKRYQRISNFMKKEILERVATDSYQRVADDLDISKSTVYNLLRFFRGKILVNPPVTKKAIEFLYVQADECYVSLQKKLPGKKRNKFIIEQITVHEGVERLCKGRNKLINKTMYSRAHEESLEDFIERVNQHILASYDYKNIYLYGDGASWIKSAADGLGAIYITDLFHTFQAVNRLTRDKDMRDYLSNAVREDDFESFEAFKRNMEAENKWTKYRDDSFKFLNNKWDSIQKNYTHPKSVGCSQEGINSHYYARRLTTTPRGFHHATARVIAQLISIKNKATDFKDYLEEYLKPEAEIPRRNSKSLPDTYVIQQGTIPNNSGTKEQRKFIRDLANPKIK
ncbi:MAG TPA: UPF0236 family protein [Erysipelotrichaceae bacterium]|nr:UPF0236 family protein [Erysipelotrichaceae bacterium]